MKRSIFRFEIVFPTCMIAALLLCFWGMYAAASYDYESWKAFSAEHHCRVVGKMSGDVVVGTGLTANGQVTTTVGFTGDKTGYICDDGVTYWR